MAVCIYPRVNVARQSFKGVKRLTVPGQSMSLREILRKFVRRESLPLSHDGVYETRFGDLEKISRLDIVEQMERVEALKVQIAAFEKRQQDALDKEKADAAAAAAIKVAPPVGVTTAQNPAPTGP